MRKTPTEWLTAAVVLADEAGAAIVVEKNHGGAFLMELLEQVMNDLGIRVPVLEVSASDGKRTRAEPVAMLYEQGHNTERHVVHHVGDLPELEDQQCNWTGEPGIPSPDRMDAAVWALAALMQGVGVSRRRKVAVGT
jgi:phage terminase large subunit-like protein